jgi:hypothetical protein
MKTLTFILSLRERKKNLFPLPLFPLPLGEGEGEGIFLSCRSIFGILENPNDRFFFPPIQN